MTPVITALSAENSSLSAQIQREREAYYDILEQTQRRSLDVTEWLAWFLDTLHGAVEQAQHTLDAVLSKARFWLHRAVHAIEPAAGEVVEQTA